MLDYISTSILGDTMSFYGVLLCSLASLVLGIGIAATYMYKNSYSKGFVVTLILLPVIVQAVIMLVNGNLGTGVAVMGAFSLIRFRSVPGNARDICSIFFAMALGIATGMGYLFFAAIFYIIIGAATLVLNGTGFGQGRQDERSLRITIPENLDYDGLFDDLFDQYADSAQLDRIKTTNMGSLYELSYTVRLKSALIPKEFMDALRCRNGNLNIVFSRSKAGREEL